MKIMKVILLSIAMFFITSVNSAYSSGYEHIVWRFAERHELGDLEPSEFCYLATNGKNVLVHSFSPGDPNTIDVYRITQKGRNNFSARLVETYIIEGNSIEREDLGSPDIINCSISGSTLVLKSAVSQLKMRKTDAYMDRAFPSTFIRKYLKH